MNNLNTYENYLKKLANNPSMMKRVFWFFFISLTLFTTVNIFKIYYYKDFVITIQINSYKKQLPLNIDSFTKLVHIEKKDYDINYTYKLHLIDKTSYDYDLSSFKNNLHDRLCEDTNSLELLKDDYSLNYTYIDKNKKHIIKIKTTKKECGEGIYDMDIIKELLKKEGY
jgi:hypothetical protein